MDQDEDQNVCVAPPAVCEAPATSSPGDADAAVASAAAGPAAGNSANPLLATVPGADAVQAPFDVDEGTKAMAEQDDQVGKVTDLVGSMAKAANLPGGEAAEGAGGKVAGLLGLPGDVAATAAGINEIAQNKPDGVLDTAIAGSGLVGDAASAVGASSVANPVNAVKGGLEIGKGAGQVIDGVTADPIAPGTSGKDTDSETVDGVENMLKGAADAGGAIPNPWVQGAGKALAGGMAIGNAIAPTIFGEKNEATPDNQTADGEYHGSTGNSWVDWAAGVGKYSNGRFEDSSAGSCK